jgi:hypothetical protein
LVTMYERFVCRGSMIELVLLMTKSSRLVVLKMNVRCTVTIEQEELPRRISLGYVVKCNLTLFELILYLNVYSFVHRASLEATSSMWRQLQGCMIS